MQNVTVFQITERLRQLPAEKLTIVYDFVSFLAEHDLRLPAAERSIAALEAALKALGPWEDSRSTEAIISDLYASRTVSHREIAL